MCRNLFNCPAAKGHVIGNGPWCYNPLLFFWSALTYSTLLTTSPIPKNMSACFVTQSLSQRKRKTLLLKCLLWLWLRNVTPRDELLAQLSPIKCVLLVTDWECIWVCIVHLYSFHNAQGLIFAGPPPSYPCVVQTPPDCWLPAACRTPEKLGFHLHLYGFVFLMM